MVKINGKTDEGLDEDVIKERKKNREMKSKEMLKNAKKKKNPEKSKK